MKKNLFFAKAFGMIVFAVVLTSCYNHFQVPELTEDKEIGLNHVLSESGITTRLHDVDIKTDGVSTTMILNFGLSLDDKIGFPAGGVWAVYADSIVVTTANKHKLKINFWKDK